MIEERPAVEFVALDLETTGMHAELDRIVEVGAVRFDATGRELGYFERLVNPGRAMSPTAQAVHGLSDADVAGAQPVGEVLTEFLSFLGGPSEALLLAHNAAFDAGFLGRELGRLGRTTPGHSIVDTLAFARRQLPDSREHRLDTLARRFGLHAEGQHRALPDSLRVKGLWLALRGPSAPETDLVAYPITDRRGPVPVPDGWDLLSDAIAHGRAVRMEYAGGSRGTAPREFTPRRFAHRGGIAYVVGCCHIDAKEKSFRLDRVRRYGLVEPAGAAVSQAACAG